MKKPLILLIVLVLIISAGFVPDWVFGQVVRPSGRIYFWQLFDTPNVYTNQAGKGVRVNTTPDALEFFTLSLGDFDNQTAWRIFYSNTDGDVTELAFGTNGQYLKSNGATSAPTWATPGGAGDLLADGTVPLTANWDVGNFDITLKSLTGDGTIEGATLTEGGNVVWNDTETDILDSGHYIAGSIDAEHLAADVIDETKIADDGIDSEHYNDGSIDAVHLAADVIDETKIADDGIDSEHYNNGSIDLVHLAAGVYAKDLVTTAPITGATDNILVGADSDVTIAITLLKDVVATSPVLIDGGTNVDDILPGSDADLTISVTVAKDIVTTAPLTGAVDNVIIGTDADITLGIDVLKDLVTTTPLTGGTDNILPGSDADITVALDFTAAWDFGGAASVELPQHATPTTDATGEIALDTTITDHQPLWQYYDGDENMTIVALPTANLNSTDNYIIKYDVASDDFQMEADAGAAGGDAWSDAVDSDILPTGNDNTYDLGSVAASFKDGYFQGTLEAGTLTEGGNAVPNATDHLGFFGGTTSAELAAEISNETGSGVAVFGTAPTFTTSITITGADASPGAAGQIRYDNSVAGLDGGALVYYDDDEVKHLMDYVTAPGDAEDDYHLAYDKDTDLMYWKADADTGGATAYDDIGDPDAAGSITFSDTETATYITETTATDFFEVQATGAFGDISIFRVSQGTGNPTDGALIESVTADAEDNVDQLLLGNGTDDQATFRIVEAGTLTIDVTSDGTATVDFPDPVTLSNITSTIQTGTVQRTDVDYTLQPAGGLSGTTHLKGLDIVAIWDSDQDGETQDGYISGGVFLSKTLDDGATGNIHNLRAIKAQSSHFGTGTVTEQMGVYSYVLNDDAHSESGDITASYNYYADAYTDKGTGTMTSRVGYFVADTTGGGNLTSQYGMYISDMTAGGTYDYGMAIAGADTYALWVSSAADTTDAANGITFGASGDTNLYRVSANVLKTDDSFASAGLTTTGNVNFSGADLELPQASPAVPDADGEVELDFTDGKMVIQHGSAHAELGGSTDIVMGSLIDSWSGTIYEPDGVNDVITVKAINSIEYPHGVVITAVYLGISSNTNYVLTVQNFDDFDTINAGNGTIDTVTYTADTTGEVIDTTPTYATIAAGQIIMISIPATDVDWIHFEIYFYEPAA